MCERAAKIIAGTLCLMRQSNFRRTYIFNNDAYVLDFRAQNYPLTFFLISILFNINKSSILGQIQHFGILNYEKQHKEGL